MSISHAYNSAPNYQSPYLNLCKMLKFSTNTQYGQLPSKEKNNNNNLSPGKSLLKVGLFLKRAKAKELGHSLHIL